MKLTGTEIYLESSSPQELRANRKDEYIRYVARNRDLKIPFNALYDQLSVALEQRGIPLHHITDAGQLLQALKTAGKETPEDQIAAQAIMNGETISENKKITGTEIYLEKFKDLEKVKTINIQPNTGPLSKGNGFKEKSKVDEPVEFSQGTKPVTHDSTEIPGPGPKNNTSETSTTTDDVNGGTDYNTKKALNPEKTPLTKLNNSRNSKLMETKNTTKSEFDRLCEEVLGPEEVELGIDTPETPETTDIDTATEGEDEGCTECSPAERIKGIISDLESIVAELEGIEPTEEPIGEPAGEDIPLEDDGATPGGAVKESAEQGGTGKIEKAPDGVKAFNPSSKKFSVASEAEPHGSGEGDGKIEGEHTGKTEKAGDGVKALDPNSKKFAVKSKITGKNQGLFRV